MLEREWELLVVVTDQELRLRPLLLELPGKVSRLLADPLLVWVLGYPKPQDASRAQLHKENDVEPAELGPPGGGRRCLEVPPTGYTSHGELEIPPGLFSSW
jgi:hypothetical protein